MTSKILGVAMVAPLLLPTSFTLAKPLDIHAEAEVTNSVLNASAKSDLKTKTEDRTEHKMNKKREIVVRGPVTAIASSMLTVTGKNGTSYSVDTTKARLVGNGEGKITLDNIKVNDMVMVNGTTTGTSTTVVAKLIRDESLQAKNSAFSGTVKTVTGTSFTLETKERGTQTVNTSSSTMIKKSGAAGTFADITAGIEVRAEGTFNKTTNTVDARSITIVNETHPVTINGTVTAKTDTSVIVTNEKGTAYTVDTTKVSVFAKAWTTLGLTDIAVGDKVQAFGIQLNKALTITGVWLRSLVK